MSFTRPSVGLIYDRVLHFRWHLEFRRTRVGGAHTQSSTDCPQACKKWLPCTENSELPTLPTISMSRKSCKCGEQWLSNGKALTFPRGNNAQCPTYICLIHKTVLCLLTFYLYLLYSVTVIIKTYMNHATTGFVLYVPIYFVDIYVFQKIYIKSRKIFCTKVQ